jgi:hypothetical protein
MDRRRSILILCCKALDLGRLQDSRQFLLPESGKFEVKIQRFQILHLETEQFRVPFRPGNRFIGHQTKGFDLRRRPLVAENYGNSLDFELLSRLEPQVSVDNGSVREGQNGHLESKLPDRRRPLIHDSIIFPRIPRIRNQIPYDAFNDFCHLPPRILYKKGCGEIVFWLNIEELMPTKSNGRTYDRSDSCHWGT